MGKTIAQKALCLPVSAGCAILPLLLDDASQEPCSHPARVVGKGEGTSSQGKQSTSSSSSSSPTSGGRRKNSSYCWLGPATPSFVASCPMDPFLKSHKKQRGHVSFSLHTLAPLSTGHCLLQHIRWFNQVLPHL